MRKIPQDLHSIKKRFYRNWCYSGLVGFSVVIKETDLFIQAERDLSLQAREAVFEIRAQLERYILFNPLFKTSLMPLPYDPFAPKIVKQMLKAAQITKVGPMAAVAGAIAQEVAKSLTPFSREVIVENGGDTYLITTRPLTVGIYAGNSPLSGRIGIKIPAGNLSVCTSSAQIGHSLSHGRADAVTVVSHDGALADAAATAIGNLVRTKEDLKQAISLAPKIQGLKGVVIVLGKYLSAWGDLELIKL